ncbi:MULTISPECIES: helix-turn-helix domain-containing protein [Thermomonosporaceae]|uniref:helix-turn-helix domain-containing protein n=1 Tax=Thermomonosporaceae TaxID=2012 RepID=UPI00255B3DB1|nr:MULTISPECIES: helix-turn-helix transcriptional regulator [Thermomonosporaceae]MDL4775800.1 helix-turn-helix transcriptional regulator [Actinomadura xylanilytica]
MPARSEPYDTPAIVTFAKELEAWRKEGGLNKKQLADALGYTDSYIGQVELCKNTPSVDFADVLDTYFKTNGVFHRLWDRIEDTKNAVTLPPGFAEYTEREKDAAHARIFSVLLVNGLFQTEEYARAVMDDVDTNIAEEFLAKRMERQSILTSDAPPHVFLTLDETALRCVIGSREIQRKQIGSLIEASERPNVTVDVVPQGRGYYPGLTGNFTILGFDDGSQAAYTESAGTGMFIEQPARVASYVVRYDLIRGHAHHIEESRTLLKTVMEEL